MCEIIDISIVTAIVQKMKIQTIHKNIVYGLLFCYNNVSCKKYVGGLI